MLIPIHDPADPRIAPFANLRGEGEPHHEQDVPTGPGTPDHFVAEGELIVRQALNSRFTIRSLLMSSAKVGAMSDVIERLGPDIPVYVAEQPMMSRVVGFKFHRGALMCAARGQPLTPERALGGASSILILEQVSNFDNLGGLFRTASALGGAKPAVLLGPGCCDPLYRKCVRVSMGHALNVPFAELAPWPISLRTLALQGFSIIGLTTNARAQDLAKMERPARPALVVGSEGAGLSDAAIAAIHECGMVARIAMRPGVDSLNVNVAAAIALFALRP